MKHLLKISQDSQASYKEYDVTYYNDNNDKVFVKKHYDNPFIKILTNSLYHDTSIIPLKAKKYGNIVGDIQWSFQLLETAESGTASINNGLLVFSKHYEGRVKLTATAGGVTAEKTVTIDCIEMPLSVTYGVVQPSPITVEWDTTEVVIAYTGQVIETFALKPQRVTNIDGLTKTVAIGTNPHVQPSYATSDEYVDLGVGLKWAKCPIGAMNEYEHGLFFQWGDVDGYVNASNEPTKVYTDSFKWNGVDVNWTVNQKGFAKVFDWAHYKYCDGTSTSMNKYNTNESYGKEVDNKTVLEDADDAVKVRIGGEGKRMPSTTEYQNLKNGTLWVWSPANTTVKVKAKDSEGKDTIIDVNYPAGYFVYKVKDEADKGKVVYAGGEIPTNYSPNAHYEEEGSQVIVDGDTHIFIPASGYCDGSSLSLRGSYGLFWSRSLYTSNPSYGHRLGFSSAGIYPQSSSDRYDGFCVRGVSEN